MQITMICLPFKFLVYIPTNKTFVEYFIIVNKKIQKNIWKKEIKAVSLQREKTESSNMRSLF